MLLFYGNMFINENCSRCLSCTCWRSSYIHQLAFWRLKMCSHAFVFLFLFFVSFLFPSFNVCVYFMPLRVYASVWLFMEKEVTLISWWCIASITLWSQSPLSPIPKLTDFFESRTIPALWEESLPHSESSGWFRNALSLSQTKSLPHPWLRLNDALILKQSPLSQSTRKRRFV